MIVERLRSLQSWVALAYAISLPLSMTASWVLLTAGLILWLVERAARVRADSSLADANAKETFTLRRDPLAPPLVLFAVAVAVSGLFNGTTEPGVFSTKGLREAFLSAWSLKAIAVYFWGRHILAGNRALVQRCVLSVLIVSSVAGIWGTIQQVFNYHPFGYHWLQGTGFLGGPMAFAGQMQIFSMLALGLLLARAPIEFYGNKLSSPFLFIALAVCNVLGLLFAGERSAWVGGFVGALALSALLSWRTFAKAAAILVIAAVLSWFTVPLVHTRIESMLHGQQDVSTRVRWQIWNRALDEFHRSPVVGIGFLRFPHLDIKEAIVPGKSKDLNHAHSNYLQMLSTTGVIGTAAYAYLCLAILFACYQRFKRSTEQNDEFGKALSLGIFAAMVSLMVSGVFEYNFGTAQVRLVQWFILAMLVDY